MSRVIAVLILCLGATSAAGAQSSPSPVSHLAWLTALSIHSGAQQAAAPQPQTSGPGRVVVTLAVEGLRIPAVHVELRNVDGNVVVGQTTSDRRRPGHVSRRAGRPLRGARPSVRALPIRESAPFTVRGGATEQVLVEMRLTFVRESVDVVAAGQLADGEPPAGGGQRRADGHEDGYPAARGRRLPVAPDDAAEHHPRPGRPAADQGRSADDRRASDEQREPQRPVHRRFRSRVAQRRRGIGRGAVEPVRGRVRPVLHERDAGAHQARHERLGGQAGQSRSRGSARASPSSTSSSRGSRSPGRSSATDCCLASTLQYRYVRTPVKSLPGDPQLGLDSFDSFTRLDAVLSSRHALTGGVIYFPRKITNATLSTFRPPETTPKFTSGRVLGRRRRSADPVGARGA